MNYLVVSNKGTIPFEFMELLGAGEPASNEGLRFFHTGAKYAIAEALRKGIAIHIYSGNWMMTPIVTEVPVSKNGEIHTVRRIDYRYKMKGNKTKVVKTGYTMDIGPNWQDEWYIVREFFANAIEQGGFEWTARNIDNTNTLPFNDKGTTVYIQMTDGIQQIVRNLGAYIRLNDDGTIPTKRAILPRSDDRPVIFRRGFRVHVLDKQDALFDYEIPDLEITEERTMRSYWDLKWNIVRMLSDCNDVDIIRRLMENFRNPDLIENALDWSYVTLPVNTRKVYNDAWNITYGNGAVLAEDKTSAEQAAAAGVKASPPPSEGGEVRETVNSSFLGALQQAEVQTAKQRLGDPNGFQFVIPDDNLSSKLEQARKLVEKILPNASLLLFKTFKHTHETAGTTFRLCKGPTEEGKSTYYIAVNETLGAWGLGDITRQILRYTMEWYDRMDWYGDYAEVVQQLQEIAVQYLMAPEPQSVNVANGWLPLPLNPADAGTEIMVHVLPDRLLLYRGEDMMVLAGNPTKGYHGVHKYSVERMSDNRLGIRVNGFLPTGEYQLIAK